MKSPLVSIIIPTYNRAHLIGETLDSVLAQTYTNWECIVVDDGSTDDTTIVLNNYCNHDQRFQYHQRPLNKPKGANACRNYGLQLAKGQYVVFFDSDDLMTPNHLEVKLKAIKQHDCQYVIAKTAYFNHPINNNILENQYKNNHQRISAYKFATHKMIWQTPDVLLNLELAKSIQFNEALQSGQEYNYFSKLCLASVDAIFIDEVLTLRRYHPQSIRANLRSNRLQTTLSFFNTYWHTYLDTQKHASTAIQQFLLYRCMRLSSKLPYQQQPVKGSLCRQLIKVFGLKGFYYVFKLYLSNIKPSK